MEDRSTLSPLLSRVASRKFSEHPTPTVRRDVAFREDQSVDDYTYITNR